MGDAPMWPMVLTAVSQISIPVLPIWEDKVDFAGIFPYGKIESFVFDIFPYG